MAGINVRLPLSRDDEDGLALNKTIEAAVRQNLKNLLLTIPGERPMIADFGVGLPEFAFENDTAELRAEIQSKIFEQVGRYMEFLEIINIFFVSDRDDPDTASNYLSILVEYNILPIDVTDSIALKLTGDEIDNTLFLDLISKQHVQDNDLANL